MKDAKHATKEDIEAKRMIDFYRQSTHRIYDIANTVKIGTTLLRKCKFPFKMEKGGKKVYEKKTLEMKVEFYQDEKAEGHRARKRLGKRELNLSDYVGQPIKFECVKLDLNNKTSHVYLTYMIHVTDDLNSDDDEEVREAEETTFLGGDMQNELSMLQAPMAKQTIRMVKRTSAVKPATVSDDEEDGKQTYNSSMADVMVDSDDEEEEKRGND